jgi:hypothetical protein
MHDIRGMFGTMCGSTLPSVYHPWNLSVMLKRYSAENPMPAMHVRLGCYGKHGG